MAKTLEVPIDLETAAALFKAKELINNLERIGKGGQLAGQESSDSFSKLGGTLTGLVTQYVSVAAAIGLVKQAIDSFEESRRRADEKQRMASMSMLGVMSMAGDLPRQGALKQMFMGGTQYGVSPTQASEMYRTIGQTWIAAPFEGRAAVLSGAMESGAAGKDVMKFAAVMAGLADLGIPNENLQGYANYLISSTSGNISAEDIDTLKVWKQAGLGTSEQGLGILVALAKGGQGTRPFRTLVEAIGKQYTRRDLAAIKEPSVRGLLQLPMEQRFGAVASDSNLQTALGITQRQRILFGEGPEGEIGVFNRGGTRLQKDIQLFGETREGRADLARRRFKAETEVAAVQRGPNTYEIGKEQAEAALDIEGAGPVRRAFWSTFKGLAWLARGAGFGPDDYEGDIPKSANIRNTAWSGPKAPSAVNIQNYYGNTPQEKAANEESRVDNP